MGAMIILIFVFVAGISLGVVFTLIALSGRRTIAEQPSNDPPLVRDSLNPYEPSSVSVGRSSPWSSNACAIAIAVSAIVGIGLLTFAAIFFYARTGTVKTTPPVLVPATPPPVLPPQSPPTSSS
jgi:hypothetical protein